MFRITFLGAGSTVFAKNVLGDCILTPGLGDFEIALFDIDPERMEDSRRMLEALNRRYGGRAVIRAFSDRREALREASFVVNAVQVGGYRPCTVTDFEIPKKYGLLQTIGDTLGIGGIFRALRTFPVLDEFAEDIHAVCPGALFLNYTNPMAMLTGYLTEHLGVNAVGLCHSVQGCVPHLLKELEIDLDPDSCRWEIAGINHQAWLLRLEDGAGKDLYPLIRERAAASDKDRVRFEILKRFGFYNTESSEHTAEYSPYFIKKNYPERIRRFDIPLDEYPRRCEAQIAGWEEMRKKLAEGAPEHEKSHEFAARILDAVLNDRPCRIHGNVINRGLISNLPDEACVEVPCLVDRNGVSPCRVGALPEQLAALNRTNINVQLLTVRAGITRKKEDVYMAAYLDPHASAELSLDEIKALCDELIEAHGSWLPELR